MHIQSLFVASFASYFQLPEENIFLTDAIIDFNDDRISEILDYLDYTIRVYNYST